MSIDETFVAYHEAGHAVAAFKHRIRYRYVSIIPDDSGTFGRVLLTLSSDDSIYYLDDPTDSERCLFERRIITYYAGYVAEAKHQNIELDSRGDYGADWENAIEHARFACGSLEEEYAFAEWLFYRTIVMFRIPRNWKMVEALAAELLKRKKIGYIDSRRIMCKATESDQIKWVDGKLVVPRIQE